MASSHGNTHSDAAKMEQQIITEFFAKSVHIIHESRSPYVSSRNYSGEQTMSSPSSSSSSSSSVRARDKWFNLALRESPAVLENLDLSPQNNPEPIMVDVILEQRPVDWNPLNFSPKRNLRNLSSKERYPHCCNSDQEELGYEAKSEKVIERWIVQYETKKLGDCSSASRRSSNNTLPTLYKKAILLLRSLYVTVRLLPAYKIFRDINCSGQIHAFKLVPKVSSFVEPFTRKDEAEMQRFGFTPVDTSSGRLCLSVFYRSSLLDISSESSTPMSPQFISDYVGSPLADPLKRFPSLPVSRGSPSSLPFSRRHSWSYENFKGSPSSLPFSPSPTHSESHALVSNPNSHRLPPFSLPPHPPETSLAHKKNRNFGEYCPSPPFSSSLSPSPPIYVPGNHLSKALLRSESAPVNIPGPKLASSPTLSNRQNLSPSPPYKLTKPNTSKADNTVGPVQIAATLDKLLSFGREEGRITSGVKISSNSSPRISFSRSSSRSFQDDFDDTEFSCPFDVEDDDIIDPSSRPESYDKKGHLSDPLEGGALFPVRKSQDAAVGDLVHMLKKAPPLHQDFSSTSSSVSRPELWRNNIQELDQISDAMTLKHVASPSITSFRPLVSKTTADALEELRGYKDMKNLLLAQGSKSYSSAGHTSKAESSSKA